MIGQSSARTRREAATGRRRSISTPHAHGITSYGCFNLAILNLKDMVVSLVPDDGKSL